MHGLIFQSFRSFLVKRYGGAAQAVAEEAAAYEPTEAYEDDDFSALLLRATADLDVPREELLEQFGEFAAAETFARLYPDYYTRSGGTRPFLLSVEERIHALVRTAVEGARPPHLHVLPFGDAGVAITYTSDRHLCRLVTGLVRGTASHYGERVAIEEPECMLRGAVACAFFVTIERKTGPGTAC